jgi:hypothetical protein
MRVAGLRWKPQPSFRWLAYGSLVSELTCALLPADWPAGSGPERTERWSMKLKT